MRRERSRFIHFLGLWRGCDRDGDDGTDEPLNPIAPAECATRNHARAKHAGNFGAATIRWPRRGSHHHRRLRHDER